MSRLTTHPTEVAIPQLRDAAKFRDLESRVANLEGRSGGEGPPSNAVFLGRASGQWGGGNAVQTVWLRDDGNAITPGVLSAFSPIWFRWQASEWARPGKTTKWWMHGQVLTNSTAQGTITYAMGVRRISSVGGGAGGIAYSITAGDTEARAMQFVNPTGGASSPVPALLSIPAVDTQYGFYMGNSVATPANTWTAMHVRLYVYWE